MPNKYSGVERRDYYRIVYPISYRPKLVVNSKEYEVIDICEKGIKFSTIFREGFLKELLIQSKIIFHDKQFLNLEGKILRVEKIILKNKITKQERAEIRVIIYLSKNIPCIPYKIIMKEQRYLRQKNPCYS